MAGFGQSTSARRGAQGIKRLSANLSLLPSASWDGTAASGFASRPIDPTRTTAKPALRLLDPPHQYFEDELIVSAIAFANDGGTLIGGIDRVRFHFEGNTQDVIEPTLRAFTRFDGSTYIVPCYTVTLKKPAGTSGNAHLYVEAIPADATMQSRVLGPFQFSPHALFDTGTIHDIELTVDPDSPEVEGGNYHTPVAAWDYLNIQQIGENPRIRILKASASGLYSMAGTHWGRYCPNGWLTIEADVPVTFGEPTFTDEDAATVLPKLDGVRIKGANVTLEMDNMFIYTQFDQYERGWWFDGVRIQNSDGITKDWMLGPRIMNAARGQNYYTDCHVTDIPSTFNTARLVRGNITSGTWNDTMSLAECIVGNVSTDHSITEWREPVDALTVQYTGSGAIATVAMTGANNASSRVITAKVDGSTVGTLTVYRPGSVFNTGRAETVEDIVDWFNTLTDWTATLLDNTRAGVRLGISTGLGNEFADTDAKTSALTMETVCDLHSDWFQAQITGNDVENIIGYGNRAYDYAGQKVFIQGQGGDKSLDIFFVNNAFDDKEVGHHPDGENPDFLFSRIARIQSHVVLAHNSFTQGFVIGSADGYTGDAYCAVLNNVFKAVLLDGVSDASVMADNHLMGGTVPSGATGTTTGGDRASLFADADGGDFTPAGDLLTNLKAPVITLDIGGNRRSAWSAAGAAGDPQTG